MPTSSGPSAENLPRARTIVGYLVKWDGTYLAELGLNDGSIGGQFDEQRREAFVFADAREASLACLWLNTDDDSTLDEPARVVRLVRRGPAR